MELERVDVPGDGDCFFHSVILGLNLGTTPYVLRGMIADYILDNPSTSEEIVDEWRDFDVLEPDENPTVEEVADTIRNTQEWATGAVINITCLILRISIKVYKKINGHIVSQTFPYPWSRKSRQVRRLVQIYSSGNHFQLLRQIQRGGSQEKENNLFMVILVVGMFFMFT